MFAEHGINSIEDLAGCATDDLTDLPERFAFITGTGGSVGRASALRFAGESALVVGCDVNVAAGEETQAAGSGLGVLTPLNILSLHDSALEDLASPETDQARPRRRRPKLCDG